MHDAGKDIQLIQDGREDHPYTDKMPDNIGLNDLEKLEIFEANNPGQLDDKQTGGMKLNDVDHCSFFEASPESEIESDGDSNDSDTSGSEEAKSEDEEWGVVSYSP